MNPRRVTLAATVALAAAALPPATATASASASAEQRASGASPTVTVKSPAYRQAFIVRRCANEGESDLRLRAVTADGVRLRVKAAEQRGRMRVVGGAGRNAIKAKGRIEELAVGDAGHIIARGTYTSGFEGAFRITGRCG